MRVAMSPLDNNCILTDRVGCISLLSQSKIAVKLKIKEITQWDSTEGIPLRPWCSVDNACKWSYLDTSGIKKSKKITTDRSNN